MRLKIDEIGKRIQINIDPNKVFLKKSDDEFYGGYMLVGRIDMSYKDKGDQEGAPIVYLDDIEAEKVRGLVDEIIS